MLTLLSHEHLDLFMFFYCIRLLLQRVYFLVYIHGMDGYWKSARLFGEIADGFVFNGCERT